MLRRSRLAASSAIGHRGFTLVEILIVVVILGVLAAIVVPQFTSASETSRENATRMNLWRIRQQIEVFTEQHHGTLPTLERFAELMTQSSNMDHQTAPVGTPGYALGPYLREIPRNPYNALNSIGHGEPGSSGWYYDEQTGEFLANDSAARRDY